jgi:carbon-monoxide dehydrogenase medium subunit
MVGVFVSQGAGGVRVAVPALQRSVSGDAMEQALTKNFSPDAVKGIAVPASELNSDMHAQRRVPVASDHGADGRAVAQALGK